MSLASDELSSLLGRSGDSWIWSDHLHAASFRGVPFAVTTGDGEFGRRQAVHEYPFRDSVWVEDLGRSTRRLTLRGFIIQSSLIYTAGDVMTQRDSLVVACETAGPGTLIHPTLGELTVSIPAGGLKITEGPAGRVFEFTLTVIESGLKVFALTDSASATSTVNTSYLSLVSKTAARFISEVSGDLRTVTQAIKTLKSTAKFWGSMVTNITDQATNLSNTLKSTFGSTRYGRYNDGSVGGSASGTTGATDNTPDTAGYAALVAQKMAQSVENHQEIDSATLALQSATSVTDYSACIQLIVDAINNDIASMADLIRAWESLSDFADTTYRPATTDSEIAAAMRLYFTALAAGAMANAAALYSPSSYDDAMNVLARVMAVIDAVSLSVADAGYDEVYSELQVLRLATVYTLQSAGADLARIKTVAFNTPLPTLTIANRLYQDASRAESLMKMANPIHPAFMPTTFKALNS